MPRARLQSRVVGRPLARCRECRRSIPDGSRFSCTHANKKKKKNNCLTVSKRMTIKDGRFFVDFFDDAFLIDRYRSPPPLSSLNINGLNVNGRGKTVVKTENSAHGGYVRRRIRTSTNSAGGTIECVSFMIKYFRW